MVQSRRRVNDAILFYILFPHQGHINAIAPQNADDLLLAKQSGRMVALRNGVYTHVSMTETRAGARKIDVDALYDAQAYRPRIKVIEGLPMYLR